MNLFDQISEDLKKAMLARQQDKLEALRGIKAALLLAKTEKGSDGTLTAELEVKILQRMVKQRKESAEIYQQQNRKDLYDKEIFEVTVIEQYLPKKLSHEELTESIKNTIAKLGAVGPSDMGKIMGLVTKELAGKADGKIISDIVKNLLNSK